MSSEAGHEYHQLCILANGLMMCCSPDSALQRQHLHDHAGRHAQGDISVIIG